MSLSTLLLGVWLILVGIDWMGWVALSATFLGIWAFVTGIVVLIEAYRPISLPKP